MKITGVRNRKPGRIAVVEEQPENIYSIRFILESLGYQVQSVASDGRYLEELEKQCPDLIIVDMLMAGGRGLSIVKGLKESGLRNISTLAISADAVPLTQEDLLKAGFADVLSKPYTVAELQEKLRKYLP